MRSAHAGAKSDAARFSEALRFYELCVDRFFGGIGTQPQWAVGGTDLPTLLETGLPRDSMNARQIGGEWHRLIESARATPRSQFYFHVPFCPTLCSFCSFYTTGNGRPDQIESYVKRLIAETDHFAPVISRLDIQGVFVGGGSPSVLSLDQIDRVFSNFLRYTSFKPGCEQTFECDPLTISREKLALIRTLGFNRISMGVQTLNPDTLHKMGRGYQDLERLKTVAGWVKELGFPLFNLDLLLGLHGDGPETFFQSLEVVAGLGPTDIMVNLLRPIKKYVGTFYTADSAQCASEIERAVIDAEARLEKKARSLGYVWDAKSKGSLVWVLYSKARPGPTAGQGDYNDRVGDNILGIGSIARSTIYGRVAYECRIPLDAEFRPETDSYHVTLQDRDIAMPVYALRQLQHPGRISAAAFKREFGKDFKQAFGAAVADLARGKKLLETKTGWKLNAKDERTKLVYALHFLGQDRLRSFLDDWNRIIIAIHAELDGKTLEFRLGNIQPGQQYAASIRKIGMQINTPGERSRELTPREQEIFLLVKEILSEESHAHQELSIPELADRLQCRLEALVASASRLTQGVRFKPISMLAEEEVGAELA